MKRRAVSLALALAGVLTTITIATAAPGAAADAPYCGIRWGSLDKQSHGTRTGQVVNVRAGRHACFDRLVFDVSRRPIGYSARYVTQVVTPDEYTPVVPVRGGARLQITLYMAYGDDSDSGDGGPTYQPANPEEMVSVTGWQTFRQVAWGGSYEGENTVGLGVRARLPYRVFTLEGPGTGSRIVVDVAHQW